MIAINSLLGLTLLLWSSLSLAQTSDEEEVSQWFDIEVLIFSQQTDTDEAWSRDIELQWPKSMVIMEGDKAFLDIPKQLDKESKTLNNRKGYKVLWHKAWRHQGLNKEEAPWILVRGGFSNYGRHELEGAIQIYLSRYSHLRTNLWLTKFKPPEEAINPPPSVPNLDGDGRAINAVKYKRKLAFKPNSSQPPNTEVDLLVDIVLPTAPSWPSLPPLPTILEEDSDCENYNLLPLWLRLQLNSITINSLESTDNSEILYTEKPENNIEKHLQELPAYRFDPSIAIPNACKLSLETGNTRIGGYFYQEMAQDDTLAINSDSTNTVIEDPFSSQAPFVWDDGLESPVSTLEQRLQDLIKIREFTRLHDPRLPPAMQAIIQGSIASSPILNSNWPPVEAIYPLNISRKILRKKLYYIDHPFLGILVQINRFK